MWNAAIAMSFYPQRILILMNWFAYLTQAHDKLFGLSYTNMQVTAPLNPKNVYSIKRVLKLFEKI